MPFNVEPFRKHCLVNGLDDIGLTMQKASNVRAFLLNYLAFYYSLFFFILRFLICRFYLIFAFFFFLSFSFLFKDNRIRAKEKQAMALVGWKELLQKWSGQACPRQEGKH